MNRQENKKWYGFTEDKVFGWVMQNKNFCKYVIQAILPDLKIDEIHSIETQDEIDHPNEYKDVRLDVLVKDTQNRIYNLEMQVVNEHNLGPRMRYYQSMLDSFALEAGHTYNDLKTSFVIFLCDFDYFKQNRIRYSFHLYEDNDKSLQLKDQANYIIINSKGSTHNQTKSLTSLVNLMNDKPVKNNPYFSYAQETISAINDNPERRQEIMDFETKLLEREQYGEQKGEIKGEQKGKQLGERTNSLNMLKALIVQLKKDGKTKLGIEQELNQLPSVLSKSEIHDLVEKYY